MKAHFLLATALLFAFGHATASGPRKNVCGELHNAFGPWDHRLGNIDNRVNIVLSVHFPPEVENNEHGARGSLGADMDYTLRALPNYVPALQAMARQARKERSVQPQGAHYPVECYFDRAVRFQPKDPAVRAAYGQWLHEQGRDKEAQQMYISAASLDPTNAAANYNVGLLYWREKDYAQANLYAQRAYALGFPLPALKNLLVNAGKWVELPADQLPVPKPAEADAPAPEAVPAGPAAPATQPPAPPVTAATPQ